MKLINFRGGFSTNSSSSHSIILLKNDKRKDELIKLADDNSDFKFDYGWEHFICHTKQQKMNYVIATIVGNMPTVRSKDESSTVKDIAQWAVYICKENDSLRELLPLVERIPNNVCDSWWTGVDHQSLIVFPDNLRGGSQIELILTAMKHIILNDKIVILGGNDNEDGPSRWGARSDTAVNVPEWTTQDNHNYQLYRTVGDIVQIFNPRTGDRKTYHKGNGFSTEFRDELASFPPALVDMCITAKCEHNCPHCYLGCTDEGEHADITDIRWTIDRLSQLGVFEVTLGGGDVFTHPDLLDIVLYLVNKDIIPSFTTRDYAKGKDFVDTFMKFVHTYGRRSERFNIFTTFPWGLSVDKAADIQSVFDMLKAERYECSSHPVIHVAVGVLPEKQTLESLRVIRNIIESKKHMYDYSPDFLLLYPKKQGRCTKTYFTEKVRKYVLDIVKADKYSNIRLDTPMVAALGDRLLLHGAMKESFFTQEGVFSKYIDCVAGTVSESSYSGKQFTFRTGGDDYKERSDNESLFSRTVCSTNLTEKGPLPKVEKQWR